MRGLGQVLNPILLILVAVGCGEDSLEPDAQILYGQWGAAGGDPAQLTALTVGAELRLACSSVATNSPVPLRPDNSFDFIGRFDGSGAQVGGSPIRARVRGRLLDESVTLSVDLGHDGDPPFSYTLQRGVDPRFEDLEIFCPQ
jgi:hypothetical protein